MNIGDIIAKKSAFLLSPPAFDSHCILRCRLYTMVFAGPELEIREESDETALETF